LNVLSSILKNDKSADLGLILYNKALENWDAFAVFQYCVATNVKTQRLIQHDQVQNWSCSESVSRPPFSSPIILM
jgi:hypothetical protein